jgi:hypothetical protein
VSASDPSSDPFSERSSARWGASYPLLGARFRFTSNSRRLLRLVDSAYGRLPMRPLTRPAPALEIELQLSPARSLRGSRAPPALKTFSAAGELFGGVMDASNFVLLSPAARSALVSVSRDMLDRPYHLRYELLEFAVYTLASRTLGLLSLHAGCVGHAGRGLLLVGESGSGKSTLALHCALQGMEFLAEDSAFIEPQRLLATGVPNFLHVLPESVALIEDSSLTKRIHRASVIERRSGARKFEVDLRRLGCRLAKVPVPLAAIVFLSRRRAGREAHLSLLPPRTVRQRFMAAQSYATLLPGWPAFARGLAGLPGYELCRGQHPSESAVALRHLLAQRRTGTQKRSG